MITTHKLFLKTPKGEITINVDSKKIKIGKDHSLVWLTPGQVKKVLKAWPKDWTETHNLVTLDKKYTLFIK